MTMTYKAVLIFATVTTLINAQRPFYAGHRPIGYPDTGITRPNINEPLPLEARGNRDLVERLERLPVDQQPFWYLNRNQYDELRKNPKTYPQRPNSFLNRKEQENLVALTFQRVLSSELSDFPILFQCTYRMEWDRQELKNIFKVARCDFLNFSILVTADYDVCGVIEYVYHILECVRNEPQRRKLIIAFYFVNCQTCDVKCPEGDEEMQCGFDAETTKYRMFPSKCAMDAYKECYKQVYIKTTLEFCVKYHNIQSRKVYGESCPVFCPSHYRPVCGASKFRDYMYRSFTNGCHLDMLNCRGEDEMFGYVEVPLEFCQRHGMKNIFKEQIVYSNVHDYRDYH